MSRTTAQEKLSPAVLPTVPRDSASDGSQSDHDDSDIELVLDDGHDDDDDDGNILTKDETEQELERLVFGNSAGVLDGIKGFAEADLNGQDEQTLGLADVDDAALFFTDLGLDGDLPALHTQQSHQAKELALRNTVWEDSDDERMVVNLAAAPRLRKLRITADEDTVDGREYSSRLRQQFELLNPVPEWALYARQKSSYKRRRLSAPDRISDTDLSDASGSADEADSLAAPPLSALLRDASSLIRSREVGSGKRRKLMPEVISIQRLPDIGADQPSSVTSLSFHPSYPLLLSSGPSSTLYLHQIARSPPAEVPSPLLVSLHIRGNPLVTTAFNPADSRIFMAGKQRHFHIWNLDSGQVEKVPQGLSQTREHTATGQFKLSPDGKLLAVRSAASQAVGVLHLLSSATLQWQMEVRIEGRGGIADFSWWRNNAGVTIAAKSGELTEWSVAEQKVVARWHDAGAFGTAVLALGGKHDLDKSPIGTDRWLAIGSTSGIVNVYDRRALFADQPPGSGTIVPAQPRPLKVLDHLVTPISFLAFSPDGQLLVMASRLKRDALRLVHMPSVTVFKNWPTSATPLGRISSLAFADGETIGGDIHSLLAVANEQGKIRAWEIL